MRMIVGLGNPGSLYEKTRHNMGFMVLDNFAKSLGIDKFKEKFNGMYETGFVHGEKILLVKPLSFMNNSGQVVKAFRDYFDIDISDILVISDDLALPFLDVRLRLFGSCGGHNGLRDIEKCLGSNKFKRFRIGIANDNRIDTVSYVLGKFSSDDMDKIYSFLPKSVNVLNDYCMMDFERLMSKYN